MPSPKNATTILLVEDDEHDRRMLLKLLKSYPWPGNVREPESLVQRILMKPIESGYILQPAAAMGYMDDSVRMPVKVEADQFDLVQIEKQTIIQALE